MGPREASPILLTLPHFMRVVPSSLYLGLWREAVSCTTLAMI